MGFQKPSKIQERALPLLLQNPCVVIHLVSLLPAHVVSHQSEEHDRAIAVGNRKDCSLRPHYALARRYGSQAAAGTHALPRKQVFRY